MINGYYYLHTNGSLIYKNYIDNGMEADFRESDFAVVYWPIDIEDRETAWTFLVEAGAAGAKMDRINELAVKWECDNIDSVHYLDRMGLEEYCDELGRYNVYKKDCEEIEDGTLGIGNSMLEALIDLCKKLGYKPSKIWGAGFKDLLK